MQELGILQRMKIKLTFEENDAYEGAGHTTKNEDEIAFEENDACKGAGHTTKNEDEMTFEENGTYKGAGHTTKNEDEIAYLRRMMLTKELAIPQRMKMK